MDLQIARGTLITEDDETPGFLCSVAAESVNDAILLLDGLRCEAEPHLRRAFEILTDYLAQQNGPLGESGIGEGKSAPKPTLSSSAIDLLVQQRLCEEEAQQAKLGNQRGRRRMRSHVGTFHPHRQRSIMLMIEALSLLDQLEDLDAVTHLQLAIDRAMDAGSEEAERAHGDKPERRGKPN
ncbi:hypothetical protein [Sphingomonas pollutisoli]|uniref:hypothetical protein n=1 Tax=Sphingomonas pollutisoli TaxID=3030829 RepID=UPI0023B98DB0|nr:hypothetical protein [Sphingomonas pollutisoli]